MVTGASWVHFKPRKTKISKKKVTDALFPPGSSVPSLRALQNEGIHMVSDLIRKGDFMVKIDLKDSYFTVPYMYVRKIRIL